MNYYKPEHIQKVAADYGINPNNLIPYGRYMAKVDYMKERKRLENSSSGKLVIVTSITPTKAGEGKTCTAIGLTQTIGKLGNRVSLCLREPSLGPIFGIKGGATGRNKAQIYPAENINLHFTGDIHAVTSAHNLLASIVDNYIVKSNVLNINPRRIVWKRALDINDRELRYVILGLKKKSKALKRSTGFIITAASEIMAILALADDVEDLRYKLGEMIVAYDYNNNPVKCKQLKIVGALVVLLKDAINPNLVQTMEGQPVFVHAGPFANIAHGNNSIIATKLALSVSDIVITESGFGSELGMEKLFDIVLPQFNIKPSGVVLVASTKALKLHGGISYEELEQKNLERLKKGFANLQHHINIIRLFGIEPVVAINKFPGDTIEELNAIKTYCDSVNVSSAISEVVAKGSEGGMELAKLVLDNLNNNLTKFSLIYSKEMTIEEKIKIVATKLYGAVGVTYSNKAKLDINFLCHRKLDKLPISIAKTQLSLTHDPKIKGVPSGWKLYVNSIKPALGAGFLVVFTGKIRLMPGLPERPAAESVDLLDDGSIKGLI